eukprot:TRINITY_DN3037_c0_g1_i1.p1 TRINITY_DN3037_c0_g1~~TRINITY_DN3037_c0_g1_i1.p1  ORF type:complete len:393 (-),score=94.30 TRINITY_DN3037_c0_g1_i1:202-1380(-)
MKTGQLTSAVEIEDTIDKLWAHKREQDVIKRMNDAEMNEALTQWATRSSRLDEEITRRIESRRFGSRAKMNALRARFRDKSATPTLGSKNVARSGTAPLSQDPLTPNQTMPNRLIRPQSQQARGPMRFRIPLPEGFAPKKDASQLQSSNTNSNSRESLPPAGKSMIYNGSQSSLGSARSQKPRKSPSTNSLSMRKANSTKSLGPPRSLTPMESLGSFSGSYLQRAAMRRQVPVLEFLPAPAQPKKPPVVPKASKAPAGKGSKGKGKGKKEVTPPLPPPEPLPRFEKSKGESGTQWTGPQGKWTIGQSEVKNDQMDEIDVIRKAFEAKGLPFNENVFKSALSTPDDNPAGIASLHLPLPGSSLATHPMLEEKKRLFEVSFQHYYIQILHMYYI